MYWIIGIVIVILIIGYLNDRDFNDRDFEAFKKRMEAIAMQDDNDR